MLCYLRIISHVGLLESGRAGTGALYAGLTYIGRGDNPGVAPGDSGGNDEPIRRNGAENAALICLRSSALALAAAAERRTSLSSLSNRNSSANTALVRFNSPTSSISDLTDLV